MRDNKKFLNGLQELNIELTQTQLDQFGKYYDLLMEWNAVMNLTAITDYNEVITKHFLDSLSIVKVIVKMKENILKENILKENVLKEDNLKENVLKENILKENVLKENVSAENVSRETLGSGQAESQIFLNSKSSIRLLDLGTGAGFPGIPLKIAFPQLEITLMDSLNKRINFLNEVISKLSLKNISAIHGRAEEFGRKEEFREQYDGCVSRAVAKLVSLSEYCLPFVKQGGYFIPYKSAKSEEELEEAKYAIGQLGGKYLGKISFLLPGSDAERTLFLIRKCRETPKKYPRAGGKPLNKPLLQNNMANPKEK